MYGERAREGAFGSHAAAREALAPCGQSADGRGSSAIVVFEHVESALQAVEQLNDRERVLKSIRLSMLKVLIMFHVQTRRISIDFCQMMKRVL